MRAPYIALVQTKAGNPESTSRSLTLVVLVYIRRDMTESAEGYPYK